MTVALTALLPAQNAEKPPHGQDLLPGPPLSPAEAIKKMKVPEGFSAFWAGRSAVRATVIATTLAADIRNFLRIAAAPWAARS
jgi:hypothetical protein